MLKVVPDNVTGIEAVVAFPATSVAWTVMVLRPGTSVRLHARLDAVTTAGSPLQVTVAMPDRASLTVPPRASCGVATVAPDAGDVMATAGGVLSSLMVSDTFAVLPALSVTVPETT